MVEPAYLYYTFKSYLINRKACGAAPFQGKYPVSSNFSVNAFLLISLLYLTKDSAGTVDGGYGNLTESVIYDDKGVTIINSTYGLLNPQGSVNFSFVSQTYPPKNEDEANLQLNQIYTTNINYASGIYADYKFATIINSPTGIIEIKLTA
jgi:hypothetical protein